MNNGAIRIALSTLIFSLAWGERLVHGDVLHGRSTAHSSNSPWSCALRRAARPPRPPQPLGVAARRNEAMPGCRGASSRFAKRALPARRVQ